MVLSGNASPYDIQRELQRIKQQTMGKTHAIPKNTESRTDGLHRPSGEEGTHEVR